ncbi:hypothetical protein SRHO_G00009210, partial [Serrasalmus rhombeus]
EESEEDIGLLNLEEIKQENIEELYCCSECGKIFEQESGLKSHQCTHAGENPYACSECGRSFRHSKTFKKHKCTRTEDGCSITVVLEPDDCEEAGGPVLIGRSRFCTATFERHSPSPGVASSFPPETHQEMLPEEHGRLLKSVEIKHENVEEPHGSSECETHFKQESDLESNHCPDTGEELPECSEGDMDISNQSHLQQQHHVHTEEGPFDCSKCGQSFDEESALNKHKCFHTTKKPYCCSSCGKSFTRSSNLQQHQR